MSKSLKHCSYHRRGNYDEALSLSDFDDLLRLDDYPFDINTFNFASPLPNTQNEDVIAPSAVALGVPNAAIDFVSEESNGQNSRPSKPLSPPTGHLRSFSLDSDFYNIGLGLIGDVNGVDEENLGRNGEWPIVHHRQNISMDGLTNVSSVEADSSMGSERKKAVTPHELAELALIDPSRYRKLRSYASFTSTSYSSFSFFIWILGNRQSTARSKVRKNLYASELEISVPTLKTKSSNVSTELTIIQRKTTELRAENKLLKVQLEAMLQQARFRDAINQLLREDLHRIKIQNFQNAAFSGNSSFSCLLSKFATKLALHHLAKNRFQHTQLTPIMLDMPPSSSSQPFNGHPGSDFFYFNQKN
ncbi:transcription factor VIP1 [Senna tora]|uniref:Transcription factor VIP1 n=1 Tax=Senna tora TaxID=362788 RepID=A0A834TFF2_9FABA|nr:transcription factor VIP1 [Senna tora]